MTAMPYVTGASEFVKRTEHACNSDETYDCHAPATIDNYMYFQILEAN